MKVYSIEFDEQERESLMRAVQQEEKRMGSLWSRVLNAEAKKIVPHPAETPREVMPPEVCESCLQMPHKPTCSWAKRLDHEERVRAQADGKTLKIESDRFEMPAPAAADPAPKPEPAKDVCAVCRKDPHASWCEGKPPRFATKECCGSKGVRHKKGCPKASGASADPAPAAEEPEEQIEEPAPEKAAPADENVEKTSTSAADEKAEPEDDEKEDQEFICKECGNTRIEPHGTKALLLSCPNGWADDPDKHVYELKEE